MFKKKLQPTRQRKNKKRIFGLKVQKHNDNKEFSIATIYGFDIPTGGKQQPYCKTFFTRESLIHELKTKKCLRNSLIFANNLGFDFWGTFFGTEYEDKFIIQLRESSLLYAKTFIIDNDFSAKKRKTSGNAPPKIEFRDTQNYCELTLEEMGEQQKLPRLETPKVVTDDTSIILYPRTQEEMDHLIEFNERDAKITFEFMSFYINAIESLGATLQYTTPASSMSLYKNQYISSTYYQKSKETLREELKSYFGGRSEAFARGTFYDAYMYDINSAFPYVMANRVYPHPNTQRSKHRDTLKYINEYEGSSTVNITVPDMKYGPLCIKDEDFITKYPVGTFEGTYTHPELRYALSLGCTINKVYRSIYYEETCRPFGCQNDLNKMRKEHKGTPMEFVIKLLSNGLYGKFGQRFDNVTTTVHKNNISNEELSKCNKWTPLGDNWFEIQKDVEPSSHCIPIWASYITAYARIYLHNLLTSHNALYCDTDSIITYEELPTGTEMGELKLVMKIKEGIIIRPKFYGIKNEDNQDVKVKGLQMHLRYEELANITPSKQYEFDKMLTLKEAIARGGIPNQLEKRTMNFSLEDNKREWVGLFSINHFQWSKPININSPNDDMREYMVQFEQQEEDLIELIASQI